MMTKDQFCRYYIERFKNQYKRNPVSEDAFKSTCLGLSMEYLGMLKNNPDVENYLSEREGNLFMYFDKEKDKVFSLSFRDILDMLPNKEEDCF